MRRVDFITHPDVVVDPQVPEGILANEFFAHPTVSVRGWETASAAQQRIVRAVREVLESDGGGGDIAIVSHGGVGTLLLCHLNEWPIDRSYEQPGRAGGNYFAFDASGPVISGWLPIDEEGVA